jgi:acetyltransferase-like isoleucine patch superfamily enzyme
MKRYQVYLKNPFSVWIRWLIMKLFVEFKFREKKLCIGYLSRCKNSKFGLHNTIYNCCILCDVELDDFTYVADNTVIGRAKIGKFCSIGPNCKIGLGRHPTSTFVSTHPIFFSTLKQSLITFADRSYFEEYRKITIGNDVWIGCNVVIVDGVSIGDGAVLGAGSVVTKDVPPYAIIGGVPSKIKKFRFKENEIEALLKIKWWNRDINWIKNNYKYFQDLSELLNIIDL